MEGEQVIKEPDKTNNPAGMVYNVVAVKPTKYANPSRRAKIY